MFSEIIKNKRYNQIFGDEFEFINTGYNTGEYNMKFDSEKSINVSDGIDLPVFRVYAWNPWSVSLGANQKESDINLDECQKKGITLVRRPTGGRAVLHANEITYSVVTRIPLNSSPQDLYREIHHVIINALNKLGSISLDFEKSQPDFRKLYKSEASSISCFASSARYEVEKDGKKVIGSAQRVINGTLLQHGSILLGKGYELLSEVSNISTPELKRQIMDITLKHSITLEEILNRPVSFDEVADCFYRTLKFE
jgi:lipoyl(octanoyl) transferase